MSMAKDLKSPKTRQQKKIDGEDAPSLHRAFRCGRRARFSAVRVNLLTYIIRRYSPKVNTFSEKFLIAERLSLPRFTNRGDDG